MSHNFDLEQIKSLPPYLQKVLYYYLPYQLISGITYKDWLEVNLKFFQNGKYQIKDIKDKILYKYIWDEKDQKLILKNDEENTQVIWYNYKNDIVSSLVKIFY